MKKGFLKNKFDIVYGKLFHVTVNPIHFKMAYFRKRIKRGPELKTILFYPEKPVSFHLIYQICHILGFKITNNVKAKADLVFKFEDTTFSPVDNVLIGLSENNRILNFNCDNISKEKVDHVFKQVFGYGLSIDPEKYDKYVRKSNYNARHNGVVMTEPAEPEPGYVYQLLINNCYGKLTKDARVPIINMKIPFVFLKYRRIDDRFDHPVRAEMAETGKEFNELEIDNILKFASKMGLDFGDVDVVRDRDSGKIYIVDVNNTPCGPPARIVKSEHGKALTVLAESFRENYFETG